MPSPARGLGADPWQEGCGCRERDGTAVPLPPCVASSANPMVRMLRASVRRFRGQMAIMIGPELTVLGVADAELPVSSETTMLL
jgi:hypothetical protein